MMRQRIFIIISTILAAVCMPLHAIEIEKHGSGSGYQTLMRGDTLQPFYYTAVPAGGVISVEGLPNGVTYVVDEELGQVHISGVPDDEPKVYTFTVKVVDGDSSAARRGRITITELLFVPEHKARLTQTIEEGDPMAAVVYKLADGATLTKVVLPDGIENVDGAEADTLRGLPTETGHLSAKLFAKKNKAIDSLIVEINVLQDGLQKLGEGSTKQIVELGDTIEPFAFHWECSGMVGLENHTDGICVTCDSVRNMIKFHGAPSHLGLHKARVSFLSTHSSTSYDVEIMVLSPVVPTISIASDESTADQTVAVGVKIDTIRIELQDADSFAVSELPHGVRVAFDEEAQEVSIFGAMLYEGDYPIKVTAVNKSGETDFDLHLVAANGGMQQTSIIDILDGAEIDTIEQYDVCGRSVGATVGALRVVKAITKDGRVVTGKIRERYDR